MPRDLTDLMERAVSVAPPETRLATDITRLAARRQRRRTTSIAAGVAALAVIAGAGLGYGLTRDHDTVPQPAGQYRYGMTVDLSSAVPVRTLPGYHREPWAVPSVQRFGAGLSPIATYRDIDRDGRMIVEKFRGGDQQGPRRFRLYAGPGQAPRLLRQPPSPGLNAGHPIAWVPSFLDPGRLLWRPDSTILDPAGVGFHLTDLDGGHDVFFASELPWGQGNVDGTPGRDTHWWTAGRSWFVSEDGTESQGRSYSLYTSTFPGPPTKVADHVALYDVADGVAAWVTTDGKVVTESASGGAQRQVEVPLDPGCRVSPPGDAQGAHLLAVSKSVIALTERCGSGTVQGYQLLAFDFSGRRLVHVTGVMAVSLSLSGNSLVFNGLDPTTQEDGPLRYDLLTGSLARLSPATRTGYLQYPQAAGDHVLWYDAHGGRVATFAQ